MEDATRIIDAQDLSRILLDSLILDHSPTREKGFGFSALKCIKLLLTDQTVTASNSSMEGTRQD